MKQFGLAALLALATLFAGCGSGSNNSNNNNVNGNWTATLLQPDGTTQLAFTTTLAQNSSNVVTGTNLSFTTASPCFSEGATETGSFALSGDFNGSVAGTLQLTVQSSSTQATSNSLTMNGKLAGNTITGTWSLAGNGSGCSGTGAFTMTR